MHACRASSVAGWAHWPEGHVSAGALGGAHERACTYTWSAWRHPDACSGSTARIHRAVQMGNFRFFYFNLKKNTIFIRRLFLGTLSSPNRGRLFRSPRPIHSVVGLDGLPFLSTNFFSFNFTTILLSLSLKKLFYESVSNIVQLFYYRTNN